MKNSQVTIIAYEGVDMWPHPHVVLCLVMCAVEHVANKDVWPNLLLEYRQSQESIMNPNITQQAQGGTYTL